MKTTKIEQLNKSDVINLTVNLFEFIELTYGISEADSRFSDYFVNHIIKYFGHLTFDDMESAFERNASGLLDIYLPKIGSRPDNKVSKFNIPDLTKIINAYCMYVGIEKNKKEYQYKEFTEQEKYESINKWCDSLCEKFDLITQNDEKPRIFCSLFTANLLADLGLINHDHIDKYEEVGKNFKSIIYSDNEILIHNTFKEMHSKGMHISNFLGKFRNKYNAEEMPIY